MEIINKLTEPNVLAYEKAFLTAIKNSDSSVLDNLMHEKLVYVHPSGQVLNKKMYLEFYKKKQVRIDHLTASDYFLNIIDDIATVSVRVKMSWGFVKTNEESKFHYTRTWKRFGKNLKIVSTSCIEIKH
jgi:ketosteroid isomerase-like protein